MYQFITKFKNLILPHYNSTKFLPNQFEFESISNLYTAVTSSKKSEKLNPLILDNTLKNFILGPFQVPFDPKTSSNDLSQKRHLSQF